MPVAPGSDGFISGFAVAAGARRDVLATWAGYQHLYAALRPAGGELGIPQALRTGPGAASVAVGDDGTAVVTLVRAGGPSVNYVTAAVRTPDAASLGPEHTIAEGAAAGTAAVGPDGEVSFVGAAGVVDPFRSAGVWVMTRHGSDWGGPEVLGDAEHFGADWPQGVYDDQGVLYVVWQHYDSVIDGDVRSVMYAESRAVTGRFSGVPTKIGSFNAVMTPPLLAAQPGGGVLAGWRVGVLGVLFVADSSSHISAQRPRPGTRRVERSRVRIVLV